MEVCLTFDMYDDNDDSWDDHYFGLLVGGTEVAQITHTGGVNTSEEHCIRASGDITLVWNLGTGTGSSDIDMDVYIDGVSYASFWGSYNDTEVYDDSMNYYADGETLLTIAGVVGSGGTDCDDSDVAIMATDADGDGNIACIDDCDDNDATLNNNDDDGDGLDSCGIYTDIDCDDSDANIGATDVDADGYIACLDDCNDNDNTSYSIWDDGDCDGTATADDCDDDDATSHIVADDADCDGDLTATDCDDTDASLTSLDDDGDSVTSCNGDCDDSDAYTYPGAAYNESVTECLTDADGDGYAPTPDSCFDLDITDSFGDGWDGAFLSVYENGSWISDHTTSGANTVDQVCMSAASWIFELSYTSGSWESEHSYTVTGATSGTVYFSDGPSPTTGTVLTVSSYGDSDDNDASVQ